MLKHKIEVPDTHCNICGEALSKQDLQNVTEVREMLGCGSRREDDEHRIRWCADCFANLLAACKRETCVAGFSEISTNDYEGQNIHPWKDKLPDKFCTVCGEGLTLHDITDRLVIQTELDGVKHEVRFCQECFEKAIQSCKRDSFIYFWDGYNNCVAEGSEVQFPPKPESSVT